MRQQRRELRGVIERRSLPPHPLQSTAPGDPEGLHRWHSTRCMQGFLLNNNIVTNWQWIHNYELLCVPEHTSLTSPESITNTTSSIVMQVSAMLVERIWNQTCRHTFNLQYFDHHESIVTCRQEELTIFLTPAGEELLSFLWSRVCMSECRVSTSNLHKATSANRWKYNHLVLIHF